MKNIKPVKTIIKDIAISVNNYDNYKMLAYKAKENKSLHIKNKVTVDIKENEIYMACYYFKTIL